MRRFIPLRLFLGVAVFSVPCGTFANSENTLTPPEMAGKIFVGYQGWFHTPNDGSGLGWGHWTKGPAPAADTITVDNWPDTSEYPPASLVNTRLTLRNGQPARLFSSADPAVTDLHFKWMRDYGIDGAFLSWYVGEGRQYGPSGQDLALNDRVELLKNVRSSAEQYRRGFSIVFDITGSDGSPSCYANAADTQPNQSQFPPGSINLTAGQSKTTRFGNLVMQRDGNLVFYDAGGHPLWATGTAGKNCSTDCKAGFQGDGNLVLYQGSKAYWASHTDGQSQSVLELSDTKPYVSIVDKRRNLITWPLPPDRYDVGLCLQERWKFLVDTLHVTQSPAYLTARGKPLLEIWGFGFTSRPSPRLHLDARQALNTIRWFTHDAPAKYQVTLIGGVPTRWKTLDGDSLSDPAWAGVYRAFDILSPWMVGRFNNEDGARKTIGSIAAADISAVQNTGQGYMPVIWPGTNFYNTLVNALGHDPEKTPKDFAPRMGGQFMWTQAYEYSRLGARTMFTATFDEMNEDTAILKMAPTLATTPEGVFAIPLNVDGFQLPSDWYLQVSRAVSRALKSDNLSVTPKLPDLPAPNPR